MTARWLLVVILAVVLLTVLWPSRPVGDEQTSLEGWFAEAHTRGLPAWIGFGLVEFAANVLMFVPLGALGVLARPPFRPAVLVACCAVLSVAVELAQWLLIPARTSDYRDVAANTRGAIVGVVIATRWGRPRTVQGRR